jgi:GT2 family glycosyltransferase
MHRADAPRATVVIPTYRGGDVLAACVDAVLAQDIAPVEVIVVVDGGEPGISANVKAAHAQVEVVHLAENRGFCAAVNAGVRRATAPIVALLNDDTVPEPDWLRHLVTAFDDDPGLGFAASRMVRFDDPKVLDGAGDAYSRHGLSFRVGRGSREHAAFPAREVIWASGGASAYRQGVLDRVGPLDECLEAYYEDVDLGLRITAAGWRGVYVPESSVRHIGGWSDPGKRSVTLTTRNSLLVIAKHWPSALIARQLPWLAYGHLRNGAWALRHGHARDWLVGVAQAARLWKSMRAAGRPQSAAWQDKLAARYPFGGTGTTVGTGVGVGAAGTLRRRPGGLGGSGQIETSSLPPESTK